MWNKVLTNIFSKREYLFSYLIIWLILAAVYFPAFTGYFVVHDDYAVWAPERDKPLQIVAMKGIGRPVAGYLLRELRTLVGSVSDANIVRFITVAILSIVATLLYLWMTKNSIKRVNALLLTVVIFTLPAFQVQVVWLTAAPGTYAALAAAISGLFGANLRGGGWIRKIIFVFFSIVAGLVSLATHQTAAMFYWVVGAVMLVSIDVRFWRQRLRSILYFFAVSFVTIGVYFAAASLLIDQPEGWAATPYSWAVTADFAGKASWFLRSPLLDAVNLWNIFPTAAFALGFALVLGAGLLCDILSSVRGVHEADERRALVGSCLWRFGLLLLLFPLSLLPNLAAKGTTSSYRSLVALSPVIVIALYWGLSRLFYFAFFRRSDILISSLLGLAALTGFFAASYTITNYYVLPHTMELKYFMMSLQNSDLEKYEEIHVLEPEDRSVRCRYDEFGAMPTLYSQDIPKIVRAALTELGKTEFVDIAVSSSTRAVPILQNEQALLIDVSSFGCPAPRTK